MLIHSAERMRWNKTHTDLLYDTVQSLWAADVETDENRIRIGVRQRPHIIVIRGTWGHNNIWHKVMVSSEKFLCVPVLSPWGPSPQPYGIYCQLGTYCISMEGDLKVSKTCISHLSRGCDLNLNMLEGTLLIQISYAQIFKYLCLVGFHTASLYHSASWWEMSYSEKDTHSKVNYSVLWTRGIRYLLKTTENASTKAKLKVEPLKFSRLIPLPVSLVNGPCYKIFHFLLTVWNSHALTRLPPLSLFIPVPWSNLKAEWCLCTFTSRSVTRAPFSYSSH